MLWFLQSKVIKGYIFFVLLLLPFFSWMSLSSDIEIVSEDETLNEFSGARAHEIVRELAREPRTLGSNAHETSQIYIKRKLIEMGCSPQKQSIVSATQTRYSIESAPIENIFCILKSQSKDSTKAPLHSNERILLMSHYDSVHNSPGASDSSAGVAILLESARALLAKNENFMNEIVLLFTDGEENGLRGSAAFVKAGYIEKLNIKFVMNFEARGNSGPAGIFETHRLSVEVVTWIKNAKYPLGNSFLDILYRFLPNETDLSTFNEKKIVGLNFAFARGMQHYHRSTDTAEDISLQSLQHEGSTAVSIIEKAVDAKLTSLSEYNRSLIYLDVLSRYFVSYPEKLVKFINILLICFIFFYLWTWNSSALKLIRAFFINLLFLGAFMTLNYFLIDFIKDKWGQDFVLQNFYALFALSFFIFFIPLHSFWLLAKFKFRETTTSLLIFYCGFLVVGHFYPETSVLFTWPLAGLLLYLLRPHFITKITALIPALLLIPQMSHMILIADSGLNLWATGLFVAYFFSLLHIILWNPYDIRTNSSGQSVEVISATSFPLTHTFIGALGIVACLLFLIPEVKKLPIRSVFIEVDNQNKLFVGLKNHPFEKSEVLGERLNEILEDDLRWALWPWIPVDESPQFYNLQESSNTDASLREETYENEYKWTSKRLSATKAQLDVPKQKGECFVLFFRSSNPLKSVLINQESPFLIPSKKLIGQAKLYFVEHCGLTKEGVSYMIEFENSLENEASLDAVFLKKSYAPLELLPKEQKSSLIYSPLSNTRYSLKKISL